MCDVYCYGGCVAQFVFVADLVCEGVSGVGPSSESDDPLVIEIFCSDDGRWLFWVGYYAQGLRVYIGVIGQNVQRRSSYVAQSRAFVFYGQDCEGIVNSCGWGRRFRFFGDLYGVGGCSVCVVGYGNGDGVLSGGELGGVQVN